MAATTSVLERRGGPVAVVGYSLALVAKKFRVTGKPLQKIGTRWIQFSRCRLDRLQFRGVGARVQE